jgi:hypothetical protein
MIPANESKIEDISNLNLFFTETLKSQKETKIGFMEFYSENKENFYKCFIYIFNGNLYTGKIRYSYDQF